MASKKIPTTIAITAILVLSGLNVNLKSANIEEMPALAQSCNNTRIQANGNKSRTFGRNTKWTTCNGYKLNFQGDGNLVLYPPSGGPLWATGTEGRATKLAVQSDGNVVLYDGNNKPIWATNTENNPGAYLAIQTDGNVVVYRKNGKPIWATNTDGGRKRTRSAASEWRAAFSRPSQPKNPSNFNSVKFSGKAHRDGVNIRSSASLSSSVVGRLQPNQRVNFDGWIHSDVVNDVWTGKPDKRWYRIPGKGWVASAVINGNAPGSSRLPGGKSSPPLSSNKQVDVAGLQRLLFRNTPVVLTGSWGQKLRVWCKNKYFVGYVDCRHTGIDFAPTSRRAGAPIYSPIEGVVIRKNNNIGAVGVYNKKSNTTFFFVHMNTISVGMNQTIRKSQQIGTVGSKGYGTGVHLHLEARPGRNTYMALDVNTTLNPLDAVNQANR